MGGGMQAGEGETRSSVSPAQIQTLLQDVSHPIP